MLRLTVKNFSCIDEAALDINSLTLVIGPQASGKSVLSKLTYFFLSLIQDQYSFVFDQKAPDEFKTFVQDKFTEWFPPSAWGVDIFCIELQAADYKIRLTRSRQSKKPSDKVRVLLSPFAQEHYDVLLERIKKAIRLAPQDEDGPTYEATLQLIETSEKVLSKALGQDFFPYQLFIPAGRSFFTSMGKAAVAFEHGLDPVTARFGRLFAANRDRLSSPHMRTVTKQLGEMDLIKGLFGGHIRFERNKEYIQTQDGRKVPFSALSSGQQELLPLLLVLNWLKPLPERFKRRRLIYIEEPEAHLFPEAQSMLVQALASLVVASKGTMSMILTTHSPYVLAKINNLIKAGSLSRKADRFAREQIDQVIPERGWLRPDRVSAFAIQNRRLESIIDPPSKLINADYLDDVSGSISREFSALLALEVPNASD